MKLRFPIFPQNFRKPLQPFILPNKPQRRPLTSLNRPLRKPLYNKPIIQKKFVEKNRKISLEFYSLLINLLKQLGPRLVIKFPNSNPNIRPLPKSPNNFNSFNISRSPNIINSFNNFNISRNPNIINNFPLFPSSFLLPILILLPLR